MNSEWIVTINHWSSVWAEGTWRACMQGSLAILIVWAACRLFPRLPTQVRCWLWRLAYAKLLIALLWATPIDIPLLRAQDAPNPVIVQGKAQNKNGVTPVAISAPALTQEHAIRKQPVVSPIQPKLSPFTILMGLWLIGVVVCTVRTLREWWAMRLSTLQRQNRVIPIDPNKHRELIADFESLCQRAGMCKPIRLFMTEVTDRPYVLGTLHPAVVLPKVQLASTDRIRMQAILAHEIAHIERRDLFWNWLPALVHTLFYFLPPIWLANREWQVAQEIACDEAAILYTQIDVAVYGGMLVDMVATRQSIAPNVPKIATVGIVETAHTLKRRLIAMKSVRPISRRTLMVAGTLSAMLAVPALLPWRVVAQEAGKERILIISNRNERHRLAIFTLNPDTGQVAELKHEPMPEFEVVDGPDKKPVLKPIAAHPDAFEIDPVWSPDHKQIAFTRMVLDKGVKGGIRANIYTMNADGTNGKEITHFSDGLRAGSPAWSPDGKYIVFTLIAPEKDAQDGISSTVMVTDFTGFWPVDNGAWPSWSHDGKRVIYSGYVNNKSLLPDLYEAKFTGADAGKKKLVSGAIQPTLSPDGKRLAYLSVQHNGKVNKIDNIYIANADGSQARQLTHFQDMKPTGLQWASDSNHIYFTRPSSSNQNRDGNGNKNRALCWIYRIDTDGNNLKVVTNGDAMDYIGTVPMQNKR